MTRSCSAWMVATTSLIRPVRRLVMLAIDSGLRIGATEAQAVLHRVQLGQPPRLLGRGEIALDPGLKRAPGAAAAEGLGEPAIGPVPRLVEQAVQHIDVRLFGADGIR